MPELALYETLTRKEEDLDLAAMVECNIAVSTAAINLANSPVFGTRARILDVRHAVVVLGARTISCLALVLGAREAFLRSDSRFLNLQTAVIKRSLMVGLIAAHQARSHSCVREIDAFWSGLFKDIGVLHMAERLGADYADRCRSEDKDQSAIEERAFGISHAELSAEWCRRCDLSSYVRETVRLHHSSPNSVAIEHAGILRRASDLERIWKRSDYSMPGSEKNQESRLFGTQSPSESLAVDHTSVLECGLDSSALIEIAEEYQSLCFCLDISG